jgi:putative ABC transport system permease protein
MVLLVGAGLMINSVLRLQQVNPGFDPTNVMNFDLSLSEGEPYVERLPGGDIERATPLVTAFYRQLLDKVAAIPGVESAGMITPFGFGYSFSVLGRPAPPPDKMPTDGFKRNQSQLVPRAENSAEEGPLSERFRFGQRAVGRGGQRDFRAALFPHENPIGQRLLLRFIDMDQKQPRQIVGVVGDVKWYLPDRDPDPSSIRPICSKARITAAEASCRIWRRR